MKKEKQSFSTTERIKRILNLGRALQVVWESSPGWTVVNAVLVAVQSLLPLLLLYLFKLIIDDVTSAAGRPDRSGMFIHIIFLISAAGITTLVIVLCRSLSDLARETQGQAVTDHVSDLIHEKSVKVDISYYENPAYHDTLYRAQEEAPYRPTRILNGLMQLVQNGITFFALAALLLTFHWAAALVLCLACIPGVLVRIRYANDMYRWQRQRTEMERRSYYYHTVLTDSGYAKEVRLFNLGELFINWFRDLRTQLRKEKLRIAKKRSVFEAVSQISATVAIFALLALIVHKAIYGLITIGSMVMYYQAFQRAQGSLQEFLTNLAGLYEDNLFIANFYEFLDLKPVVTERPCPEPFPRFPGTGIEYKHVSFQYPGADRFVLRDVSLHVPRGKIVALVGENGSGKTTLVKLLCRLYDPEEGSISIDGQDLKDLKLEDLRSSISVIFQDYVHYNLPARENIRLGNLLLDTDDVRIREAARRTGADDFIKGLPDGYDTVLGHWFERGSELSVGEWQKVALARTFLRDAEVVILDEPTSSMDAKAEYEVFAAFRELLSGRTGILISHRFSTVRLADYIYVLADGAIVESGTHDELVNLGGRYAELFEMQAESYR